MKKIKGYKAMNADMTCRDFQFKVGNTYKLDAIKICKQGFHFCENAFDVYNYYNKNENTVVCEVEAIGEVIKEGDKSVTDKIKIVRRLTDKELLKLWINRTNSGDYNSGYYNSGYRNSGYRNSGNCNSGDYNSGYYNSGDYNSGDYNSGDYNSGNCNSGDYNSGYYNSGDYNSGNYNSGYFNNTTPKVRIFNIETGLEFNDPKIVRLNSLNVKPILSWVDSSVMTDEEKANHKSYVTTGGFLRNTGRMNWTLLTDDDKKAIRSLPNYDDAVFKEITGISLIEEETIEVQVNGATKTIKKKDAKILGLIE